MCPHTCPPAAACLCVYTVCTGWGHGGYRTGSLAHIGLQIHEKGTQTWKNLQAVQAPLVDMLMAKLELPLDFIPLLFVYFGNKINFHMHYQCMCVSWFIPKS